MWLFPDLDLELERGRAATATETFFSFLEIDRRLMPGAGGTDLRWASWTKSS
jgi:hypothetical protein